MRLMQAMPRLTWAMVPSGCSNTVGVTAIAAQAADNVVTVTDGGAPGWVRFDTSGNAIDAHDGEIKQFSYVGKTKVAPKYYLYGTAYSCGYVRFHGYNGDTRPVTPFCGFTVYESTHVHVTPLPTLALASLSQCFRAAVAEAVVFASARAQAHARASRMRSRINALLSPKGWEPRQTVCKAADCGRRGSFVLDAAHRLFKMADSATVRKARLNRWTETGLSPGHATKVAFLQPIAV